MGTQNILALCTGFLGLLHGAAWGGRYGSLGALGGGIVGLTLGVIAGHLYYLMVVDLIFGWAAGLVKRGSRIGIPLFAALLLLQLALWIGLGLLSVAWLDRVGSEPRPNLALQRTPAAAAGFR